MSKAMNFYISCPMTVPQPHLDRIALKVRGLDVNATYWERGTHYDETDTIRDCDGFIIVLPNNKFDYTLQVLPTGCMKELEFARKLGKEIFLAYESQGGLQLYNTEIEKNMYGKEFITGIAGTTRNFEAWVKAESAVTKAISNRSNNPCGEVYLKGIDTHYAQPVESLNVILQSYDKRLLLS